MSGLSLLPSFQELESPRVRDVERRFLERAGWTPTMSKDVDGKNRWLWQDPEEDIFLPRGQAFAYELYMRSR